MYFCDLNSYLYNVEARIAARLDPKGFASQLPSWPCHKGLKGNVRVF